MRKEDMISIIEKEFGVNSISSPFGSCKADFLNNKIVEIAEKYSFPQEVIEIFKKYPYVFPKYKHWDNGSGAGRYFIGLLKI